MSQAPITLVRSSVAYFLCYSALAFLLECLWKHMSSEDFRTLSFHDGSAKTLNE
ncbi:hypothetical protein KIN20_035826 [Parelaphostrongylus tenuis]|uniref:Uncharacterized protein n=1 Tax=Parelaphostrongylus tenuis TaxID=148309 RepID=A0AAD5WK89_PARTN|nr:hypothetical protein KIN20_035826 [Parelaphostrongylus tenuis]